MKAETLVLPLKETRYVEGFDLFVTVQKADSHFGMSNYDYCIIIGSHGLENEEDFVRHGGCMKYVRGEETFEIRIMRPNPEGQKGSVEIAVTKVR